MVRHSRQQTAEVTAVCSNRSIISSWDVLPTYSYLALAFRGFGATHVLRVHDYSVSLEQMKRARNEFNIKGECTCLKWIVQAKSNLRKRKREERKREGLMMAKDVVLAVALKGGLVKIYNIADNEIKGEYNSDHFHDIQQMDYNPGSGILFGCTSEGEVAYWNTYSGERLRTILLEDMALSAIRLFDTKILVASHTVSIIDPESTFRDTICCSLTAHITAVHTIQILDDDIICTAAHNDRYINIHRITKDGFCHEKSLVCRANVSTVSISANAVCAIGTDGTIELFHNPLESLKYGDQKHRTLSSDTLLDCNSGFAFAAQIESDYLLLFWLNGIQIGCDRILLNTT